LLFTYQKKDKEDDGKWVEKDKGLNNGSFSDWSVSWL